MACRRLRAVFDLGPAVPATMAVTPGFFEDATSALLAGRTILLEEAGLAGAG
jgi:hypothetical protein